MLPNRCSVIESSKQCVNLPFKVVSITSDNAQYMIGVSCERHSMAFLAHLKKLQQNGKLQNGEIVLENLSAVGTNCIHAQKDELLMPNSDILHISDSKNI